MSRAAGPFFRQTAQIMGIFGQRKKGSISTPSLKNQKYSAMAAITKIDPRAIYEVVFCENLKILSEIALAAILPLMV